MVKGGGNIIIVGTKNSEYVCDVNGKASKIRNGTNSPVVSDIFEYYSGYAKSIGETYWEDLFTNASKNFFPNKMYKIIDNRMLTAKLSASVQQFDLMPPNRESFPLFYEKCKEFFTNTSGVASKDDVFLEIQASKYDYEPWSGSIPPQRQVAMIDIFVNEKAIEHSLSDETKIELKENLIGKIFTGELGPRIQKCGYAIVNIEGLSFNNGKYWLPTDPPRTGVTNKKKTSTTLHEEEPERFVFKCSKNISNSLKERVRKGFSVENFQLA